jgi:hypothetical protein
MRGILMLCLMIAALLPAVAMMAAVTEQELVATSDLVIVGTVQADVVLPDVQSWSAGKATITVNRLLRGAPVETVTVRHAVPPSRENGMIIMDHGGFTLTPGQQQVFFLTRGRDGYTITGGFQGMRKPEEAARFSTMLTAPAVTVAYAATVRPIFFDQPYEIKLSVKNATDTAVNVYPPRLIGFYYSTLLDPFLVINPPAADNQTAVLVKPGESATLTQKFTCAPTGNWKNFPPESFMLTPATIRAHVFVQTTATPPVGYPITTPWQNIIIGYFPPADARK